MMKLFRYLVTMSSSAQMLCCIAAQDRAEQTGEGCNTLKCAVRHAAMLMPMSMDSSLALPSKPKMRYVMPGKTR